MFAFYVCVLYLYFGMQYGCVWKSNGETYGSSTFVFQVDLALNVEKAFPRFLRRRFVSKQEIRHPNWYREKLFLSLDGEKIREHLQIEKVWITGVVSGVDEGPRIFAQDICAKCYIS